jgi:hypothetical protein
MTDGSRQPCVVIQTKRSSTAQNGNDVPSHDGNRAKRAKPATPSNSVVPVVDETSEDDEEPPPFELERISENKANKSSSTLTIAIKGLKTDRRGNTTYEAFEVDTVEGKVELGSNLQKVVNSLLCGAMEQMRTNAQQDDFEEDAETIETEDDGDSGERQIPRDQYHPNAPMTEVSIPDILSSLGKRADQSTRKISMITGDLSETNTMLANPRVQQKAANLKTISAAPKSGRAALQTAIARAHVTTPSMLPSRIACSAATQTSTAENSHQTRAS